jgi:hypothetical protein
MAHLVDRDACNRRFDTLHAVHQLATHATLLHGDTVNTSKFVTLFSRKKADRLTVLAQVIPLGQRRGEAYFKVVNDQYEMFGWFRTLHSGKEVFRVNIHDIRNLCEVTS